MQIQYQDHQGHNLIIFMAGWGTTPEVVSHLALPRDTDYVGIHDYNQLCDTTDVQQLQQITNQSYTRVWLVAWSMGVWAAEVVADLLPPLHMAIAIAGTPKPIDDNYGIPEAIFMGTLDGLSDANRARFDRRMCGGKKLLSVYQSFAARSTDDLRAELSYVAEEGKYTPTSHRIEWTYSLIGSRDMIIPVENQLHYWEEQQVPCHLLEGVGHYPFNEFESWSELFELPLR